MSLAFHAASLPTELSCLFVMLDELKTWLINEPSRDKSCPRDFSPAPNTNRAVRPQNMTIGLKFRNQEVEKLYEGCQKSSWTPMIIASNEPDFDIHYYFSLK